MSQSKFHYKVKNELSHCCRDFYIANGSLTRNKRRLHAQWLRIVCARVREHRKLLTVSEQCVWAETHGGTPHRSALFTYQVQSSSGKLSIPSYLFLCIWDYFSYTILFDMKSSHVSKCPLKKISKMRSSYYSHKFCKTAKGFYLSLLLLKCICSNKCH